ncbi:porin [Paraburkholderia aspalathi]|uniref:Outer membrane protein (Porin) n=1 Tax=Paraburkholderia aspalathi TaxID=1324617 RepID=A0A1I6YG09_9BURK|nr:porin [Paraburkholderia aspalathi]SFT49348.1 Outer membrane protein (porin) [Paraburkholderia aspalathi]
MSNQRNTVFLALALGLPICAQAQSSVTLYGVLDAGLIFANNVGGSHLYATQAGWYQGNRWGMTGIEDLGGGYQAIFRLESGFSPLTGAMGQGNSMFGRQAFVGVTSPYGAVTLGRQYDSIVDYVEPARASTALLINHPAEFDNLGNDYRLNNVVKFASVDYGGLKFGGLFSAGGVAGSFERNRAWSLGTSYKRGPLFFGLAYLNARDPNFSYYGNNPSSSTTASNMSSYRVFSGYASARSLETFAATTGYTAGAWSLAATYTNVRFKGLGAIAALDSNGYRGTASFNTAEVAMGYSFTPSLKLGASYQYIHGAPVNGGDSGRVTYHEADVSLDYFLSKRTDMYAMVMGQQASGRDSTGRNAVAQLWALSASSSNRQVGAVVGLRHKF